MATSDDDTDEYPTFADGELPSVTREAVTVEFCPPFPPSSTAQPMTFDPDWRTETVVALARGIDADSAFDRLPILADALEEAGCDHPQLLHHCRTCPHPFASCWVVNVVLDRVPGELPPPVVMPPAISDAPAPRPSPRSSFAGRFSSSVGWKPIAWGLAIFMVVFQLFRMLNIITPKPTNPPVTVSSATP